MRRRFRLRSQEVILIAAMMLLALTAADQYLDLGRWGAVPTVESGELSGAPQVTDGDTLRLNGVRIRLAGIDAPEISTAAGRAAKRHLAELIAGADVGCIDTGERSYDRVVAICSLAGGEDMAGRMVADGWAMEAPRFSGGRYAELQRQAEGRALGMHGGDWD
ncbi:MAG TPA: thermonuclease family protein [Caulobacteraceae bacterium]|nr:thermonuclease family protein [Caulobacteraceae bacterium]